MQKHFRHHLLPMYSVILLPTRSLSSAQGLLFQLQAPGPHIPTGNLPSLILLLNLLLYLHCVQVTPKPSAAQLAVWIPCHPLQCLSLVSSTNEKSGLGSAPSISNRPIEGASVLITSVPGILRHGILTWMQLWDSWITLSNSALGFLPLLHCAPYFPTGRKLLRKALKLIQGSVPCLWLVLILSEHGLSA